MSYQRHWLLSFGGTLAGGQDVWANNVRMVNREAGSFDSIGDATMEDLLTGFVADIKAMITNPGTFVSNAVECTWVKFNEIDADGHYARPDKTFVRFLQGTTGTMARFKGGAGLVPPPFQSVCVTTTTDLQRGPGSKGRLFLPQCAAEAGDTSRILLAHQTSIANNLATFFTNLGNEDGIDDTAIAPAVVSNVGDPGPANRITGVRVGDVHDVIRRRKSALVEKYVTASVSTA